MNPKYLIPAAVALTAAFTTSTASAATAAIGVNLVHNGNAEAGTGKFGAGAAGSTMPGWSDTGGTYGDTLVTTSGTYSANTQTYAGGYSQGGAQNAIADVSTHYGSASAGNPIKGNGNLLGGKYLYAGNSNQFSFDLSQTINLTGSAALMSLIATGTAEFGMEGWFGGFGPSNPGDYGQFVMEFLDGSNNVISSSTAGPTATPADTSMHFYSNGGFVPVDAESIRFIARFNRTWSGNDAAIDNLAFVIAAPIPEPSAALLGGFGALVLLRRRRNS